MRRRAVMAWMGLAIGLAVTLALPLPRLPNGKVDRRAAGAQPDAR